MTGKTFTDTENKNNKTTKSHPLSDWDCHTGNPVIKAAKELFYNKKFIGTNGDARKTWQIINDLTSWKVVNSSIRETNLNGTSMSESFNLSNAFNDRFSSI